MSARGAGAPFPSPSLAFALALLAMFVQAALAAAFGGHVAAISFGAVLGFGGIGMLAARYVAEPAVQRLGLMPFRASSVLPILLSMPVVLLTSEVDNWIRLAAGAGQSAGLGKAIDVAPEELLSFVLLVPVVREFFLRGVLLQGSVSALGRAPGVAFVALLQALLFAQGGEATGAGALSALVQTFVLGALLGLVRLASGSLLPGMALACALAAISAGVSVFPDRVAIPGFNAPGATTPLVYLVPAAASVALGIWLLAQQLAREPELPPIPPRTPKDDEEPGPLF